MTYFKTTVTLTSGYHRILRLTLGDVAHFVSEFRKMQRNVFREVVSVTLGGISLCLNEISSIRFVNEYTREEFLTLA